MELKVQYFGMIAEATHKQEEIISVQDQCDLHELTILLKEKYETLQKISFTIAIDQEITTSNRALAPLHEIALLPPFSGG